ncbi:hypothetical protein GZ78_16350 [Endozoicomonas numazuensis]|uniref:Uncharacterized protein n=2 Tax=Endozoicomonas numazuensis TaxID=1137799 RepID=A0A081NFZ5_9GAMM|nr:hypothetical protein GZ78_16350 [Endozoicomonas numazuensis]
MLVPFMLVAPIPESALAMEVSSVEYQAPNGTYFAPVEVLPKQRYKAHIGAYNANGTDYYVSHVSFEAGNPMNVFPILYDVKNKKYQFLMDEPDVNGKWFDAKEDIINQISKTHQIHLNFQNYRVTNVGKKGVIVGYGGGSEDKDPQADAINPLFRNASSTQWERLTDQYANHTEGWHSTPIVATDDGSRIVGFYANKLVNWSADSKGDYVQKNIDQFSQIEEQIETQDLGYQPVYSNDDLSQVVFNLVPKRSAFDADSPDQGTREFDYRVIILSRKENNSTFLESYYPYTGLALGVDGNKIYLANEDTQEILAVSIDQDYPIDNRDLQASNNELHLSIFNRASHVGLEYFQLGETFYNSVIAVYNEPAYSSISNPVAIMFGDGKGFINQFDFALANNIPSAIFKAEIIDITDENGDLTIRLGDRGKIMVVTIKDPKF